MTIKTIVTCSALCSLFILPLTGTAGELEDAIKGASAEIDKAKVLGYEWRDSRKFLKKALKAEKDGDHKNAMKLANKARQQGIIAVSKAKLQANVQGPY